MNMSKLDYADDAALVDDDAATATTRVSDPTNRVSAMKEAEVLSCLMYWQTLLWSQTVRGGAHGLV